MPEMQTVPRCLATLGRALTTMLCCGWGFSFAYSFFRCVSDKSSMLVCAAAVLPLTAVWAALERKRWGRLVLQVLSLLAQALFGIMLVMLMVTDRVYVAPGDRHLWGYLLYTIRLFAETPSTTLAILLLSATTSIWFTMPWVRKDYEVGKKVVLTPGQRIIAASVVAFWGLTMSVTPTVLESRSTYIPLKAPRRLSMRY